jgi:hypothetical protein
VFEVADARRADALPARYLANRVGEADVAVLGVDRRGVIQHEGVDAAANVDAPASRSFMPRKRAALILTSEHDHERDLSENDLYDNCGLSRLLTKTADAPRSVVCCPV